MRLDPPYVCYIHDCVDTIPLSSAEGFLDKSILSKADLGFDVKAVASF